MFVTNKETLSPSAGASHLRKLFTCLSCIVLMGLSMSTLAELEELDDQKLEALRGKEGITIDLSYKLSIGEIAWQFNDPELEEDRRKNTLAPPPPRIEYHVNGK